MGRGCQFPQKALSELLPAFFKSGRKQHPYVVHYAVKGGKLFVGENIPDCVDDKKQHRRK
jgi:hypothetical protein